MRPVIAGSAHMLRRAEGADDDLFFEYGYVWLPYAVAALALLGLGAVAAIRSRRGSRGVAGDLMTGGAVLALSAAIVAGLANAALDSSGVAVIDPLVWAWMIEHRTAALTSVATVVTAVGSTVGMTVLATVTVVVLWAKGRRSDAILVAVVGIGAGVLVRAGKATVGRERPPVEYRLAVESSESFPSGHALASAAILGVVAAVLLPLLSRVWARLLLLAAVVLFGLAIGLTRPYLGVHWATDVLAGWVFGLTWLYLCVMGRSMWRRRRGVVRAVEPDERAPAEDPQRADAGDVGEGRSDQDRSTGTAR